MTVKIFRNYCNKLKLWMITIVKPLFYCALAFVRHYDDPVPLICQGKWEGVLLRAPQGNNGFGYDPIFYVQEYQCMCCRITF